MSFKQAVLSTPVMTTTTNGMAAQTSSMNASVDLFYNIGASRGRNVTALFDAAYEEDADVALRIAQWARDIRGGAGERKIYRDILLHLERLRPEVLTNTRILQNTAEIGRWDDLLIFKTPAIKQVAYAIIAKALSEKNGLCAKWMPRQKYPANELREFLGLSPKRYRKLLVTLTNVVETQMCAREFREIEFKKVPSVAMSTYMTAFHKHAPVEMAAYKAALVKGETKINASALYPHDVVRNLRKDVGLANAQWDALPNYMGDAKVLPMVDVSGSMSCPVNGTYTGKADALSCMDVAVALGLYCASKNTGPFADMFVEFSSHAKINVIKGNLASKNSQLRRMNWAMSTDLSAAFNSILAVATRAKVAAEDMPEILLILSDMQFNACVVNGRDTALTMIERKYEDAGYKVPKIVFWNLNSSDNTPVSFDQNDTALVSGFSPALLKAVLSNDLEQFTPINVMREAISDERYSL